MKIGFLFPGQGTQTIGMGKDLYEKYEEYRKIYEKVNKIRADGEEETKEAGWSCYGSSVECGSCTVCAICDSVGQFWKWRADADGVSGSDTDEQYSSAKQFFEAV